MITKRDVHALQQKIAALQAALSVAEDLRRSEVTAALAECDRIKAAMSRMSAAAKERDRERNAERAYLAEQVETYKAQAESRGRDVQRLEVEGTALARKLDEAKTREAILNDQIRSAKATAKADAETASKTIRKLQTTMHNSIAGLQAELVEMQREAARAKSEAATLKAKLEKAPAPQVIREKAEPEIRIIEKIVCEREPADVAEIERLKKELAACQSGQAGE